MWGGVCKVLRDPASCKADFKNIQFVSCMMSGAYSIFHLSLSNKKHPWGGKGISLPSHWALSAYVELTLWPRVGGSMRFVIGGARKGWSLLWTILTGLSLYKSLLHFICMTSLDMNVPVCTWHSWLVFWSARFAPRPVDRTSLLSNSVGFLSHSRQMDRALLQTTHIS